MAKSKKTTRLKLDVLGVISILLAIYLYICIFEKDSGLIGKYVNKILFGIFGMGSYLFPIIIFVLGIAVFYLKDRIKINIRFYSFCLAFITLLVLLFVINRSIFQESNLDYIETVIASYELGAQKIGGGIIGAILGYIMIKVFGIAGTYAFIAGLFFISLMMFTGITVASFLDYFKSFFLSVFSKMNIKRVSVKKPMKKMEKEKPIIEAQHDNNVKLNNIEEKKVKIIDFTKEFDNSFQTKHKEKHNVKQDSKDEAIIKSDSSKQNNNEDKIKPNSPEHYPHYSLPSPTLLFPPQESKGGNIEKEIMNNVKTLEETLKNFNVDATVSQVSVGPSITRYELQLSPGVKVSKIVNLADDISLSMASQGIRIEAPIPGKSAVGIEIPNKEVTAVCLREVIESDEFNNNKSKIAFALGKDVAGQNIIADIAKMPHLLIAGATGSGKSVCINTIIISILYKAEPDKVKLLMIDPKVVELSIYNGIPHLLVPVVTDPKKAAGALNWAVNEMTERYKKFASKNVRDVNSYNALFTEDSEKLPQIVVIIDELADLMMVAPNDVEDAICRLAQMARAAGIHLVIATQRPSVDVITGLIKANIPSRISFAVSSQVDSRTILDMAGAEKLLGRGDMLYYPVGESKPIRVQGAYISEKEVESVVEYIKGQVSPSYVEDIVNEIEKEKDEEADGEADELLNEAISLVVETGQASILMLQRRLKIGYSRAARIIDQMEERRIIGGYEGSKPRKVLITKEQWQEMQE
ncbi:FtsK/SpoIIIE family DNA translocase [Lutispora thermophila]|uniref:DNA segregation ATPase FtsK/SpoIIIE, S-DNA-T family n=1 Tax=Lutispora thermophila DSM 19022 TaxID=1122184 RepID=A0A1M6I5S6_9FIRM|nr:DNA translocase FtsK [Lutispora thermophila]SHJ29807.1 DNA segregation ATPase FtsK/SpoIIIE, S-DNA-T family [Lutispora thermophila DSM 19022]